MTLSAWGVRGSSPLARGLLWGEPDRDVGGGIIPARAGFTGRRATVSTPRLDHPRSRGVYRDTVMAPRMVAGSSPLARGLPDREVGRVGGGGIIPARAGFTRRPARRGRRRRDHPRSRGVYSTGHGRPRPTRGSSPLARGLPYHVSATRNFRRIIPARAGFTDPHGLRVGGAGDHPRSRGVYRGDPTISAGTLGSSPLARGLQMKDFSFDATWWIIPARAGFTRPPASR